MQSDDALTVFLEQIGPFQQHIERRAEHLAPICQAVFDLRWHLCTRVHTSARSKLIMNWKRAYTVYFHSFECCHGPTYAFPLLKMN